VEAPRHFRAAQANLKKLQRRFSQATQYTPRWYRLLRALGKAHAKVRRKRQDFLHDEANKLLDRADVVVCEDLKIANMTRRPKPKQDESGTYRPNGAKAKSGLNKSILDAGWGMFVQMLRYKRLRGASKSLPSPRTTPRKDAVHAAKSSRNRCRTGRMLVRVALCRIVIKTLLSTF
jgi:putative transposase